MYCLKSEQNERLVKKLNKHNRAVIVVAHQYSLFCSNIQWNMKVQGNYKNELKTVGA